MLRKAGEDEGEVNSVKVNLEKEMKIKERITMRDSKEKRRPAVKL